MSMMNKPFQFVTLVSRGGTPVTIADQTGAPYPTTGYGALVFNHEPELFSPIIHDGVFEGLSFPSPLTSLGDLYYHDAFSDTRLPMGPPGTFLQAQADGLHWTPQGTQGTLPAGGTSGQVLTKASGIDFDAIWSTPAGGGGGGGTPSGAYNTAQDVLGTIVPAPVMFVTTQGFTNIGDGGGARYVRTNAVRLTDPVALVNTVSDTIKTGSYGTGSGNITLSTNGASVPAVGQPITVTGLTGTGNAAALNGTWTCLSINTMNWTMTLAGPVGQGTIVVNGGVGSLSWAGQFYNTLSGLLTITLPGLNRVFLDAGQKVTLSGLAGTGDFASFNGQWSVSTAVKNNRSIGLTAPGHATSTITAGTAVWPAHTLYLTDQAAGLFEIFSDPIPLKAAGALGNGVRNPIDGSFSGTSDANAMRHWVDACNALGYNGHATKGYYLNDQGGLCQWDVVKGLKLTGEAGKTVFVHQIGHPGGEAGFSYMFGFGRETCTANSGGGSGNASSVNFVPETQSGIVTAGQDAVRGLTTVLQLNTLRIANVDSGPVDRDIQVGDYVLIKDPQQPVPYRGNPIVAITAITNSYPCLLTAPGHGIDPNDVNGEVTPVSGVNGMIEINGHSYTMIASAEFPDLLTLPNVDSTGWGVYTGGGQIGNGGIANYLNQNNQVIAVDPVAKTITLDTIMEFPYKVGTQIGVWWNPATDITWDGIDIQYDLVKSYHEGVVAAVKFTNCVGVRITGLNVDYATSRVFTSQNSMQGVMDRVISSFNPSDAANTIGIQGWSWGWTVSNCLQTRGGHLAQNGGSYIDCFGNQGFGTGPFLDTHWPARNVSYRGNKVWGQLNPMEGNTNHGGGMTHRGWYMCSMIDNEIYGHADGLRWHQGGGLGGNICFGNLLVGCKNGIYANNFDHLTIESNKFIGCTGIGLSMMYAVGAAQGFQPFSDMVVKKNTFIGPSTLAAFQLQLAQQPDFPRGWTLQDFDISGNPANEFVGLGDIAGRLQYYIGGRSTEPGRQGFGPWYPLSLTTGALSVTADPSAVVGKYRPGDIVTAAGGTSTSMLTVRVGDVTVTGLSASQKGGGFKVGDKFFLQGGVINTVQLPSITSCVFDNTTGNITVTYSTNHNLVTNTAVRLATTSGTGSWQALNDTWLVSTVVNPTQVVLAGPAGVGPATVLSSNSTLNAVMITVTGITSLTPPLIINGVEYGPLNTFNFSTGITFSSLPAGDIFGSSACYRPAPPGGMKGNWRSVATYQTGQGVGLAGNIYVSLQDNNTNHNPTADNPAAPVWWQMRAPTGFQARFRVDNTGPSGAVQIRDAGAYSATPPNPVGQLSSTGTGTGLLLNVTWATNTLLDVGTSPKVLVQATTSGGTITSLGQTKNVHRVIRLLQDTTWQAGPNLIPPGGITQLVRTGWQGDWYSDDSSPPIWRCTGQLPAVIDQLMSQQAAFPAAPSAGFTREWADNTGRTLRTLPDGTTVINGLPSMRARAQNNSRDFTQPMRTHAVASGVTTTTFTLPGIASGTYSNGPGTITLTFSAAHGVYHGQWITLSGLTGTGTNLATLNGTWQVSSLSSPTVLVLNGPPGAGSITITGGAAATTNLITLTMAFPTNLAVGQPAALSCTNGTGAYLSLSGTWLIVNPAPSGTTVTLAGPSGVGAATITAATLGQPPMVFTALPGATSQAIPGLPTTSPAPVTNANFFTRKPRQILTGTTGNSYDTNWESSFPIYLADPGRVVIEGGWEVIASAAQTGFFGLKVSGGIGTLNVTTTVPSLIGIGFNSAGTVWSLIHGDATVPGSSATSLGANFPCNTAQSDRYKVSIWWAAGAPQVWWEVVRTTSAGAIFVANGVFTTEIPDINTPLFLGLWSNNRNAGVAQAVALFDAYFDG